MPSISCPSGADVTYVDAVPKIVDHEAYRAELVAQSFELFARHGYATLTMRALATGLGVSTGTLYHYFSTKEELFHRVVSSLTQQEFAVAIQQIPADSSIEDRIVAAYRYVDENSRSIFLRMRVIEEYLTTVATEEGRRQYYEIDARNSYLHLIFRIPNPLVSELVKANLLGLIHMKESEELSVDFTAHALLMAKIVAKFG
jgi:AcrR family transcriptional regulator